MHVDMYVHVCTLAYSHMVLLIHIWYNILRICLRHFLTCSRHAGYRYSGPCAAHAYKQVDPFRV